MNLSTLFFLATLTICSCTTNATKDEFEHGKTYYLKNKNTLYSKLDSCSSEGTSQSFQEFWGIRISSDYKLKDSISIDLNGDRISDKLIILSPVVQEKYQPNSKCNHSRYNNRLLAGIIFSSNGNRIQIISETAILNNGEFYEFPYKGLTKDSTGFTLKFFVGISTKCYYYFHFMQNEGAYYLNSSKYDCYMLKPGSGEAKETQYAFSDSTALNRFDVRKFISFPQQEN